MREFDPNQALVALAVIAMLVVAGLFNYRLELGPDGLAFDRIESSTYRP